MLPSGRTPTGHVALAPVHVALAPVHVAPLHSDQGSQFTGQDWTGELEKNGIRISMDGKGRWMDNIFIERLWRSLEYERIRLYSYATVGELKEHVSEWMSYYNHKRKHQHLDYQTPWSRYTAPGTTLPKAA